MPRLYRAKSKPSSGELASWNGRTDSEMRLERKETQVGAAGKGEQSLL